MTATRHAHPAHQKGSALIIGLVFLLILTIVSLSSMRGTTLQERMAGNLRDRNLAFQAAESALRDGETFLQQASLPVFEDANGLLYMRPRAGRVDYWNDYFNGENYRIADPVPGVPNPPVYVIEEMPAIPGTGDSVAFGPLPDVGVYRITARATGGTPDAVVILQTTYRR